MKSGMAETIKHACMASEDMFEFLEENMDDIMSFSKFACEYIAENNCQIKYKVVMQDERESGLREILNLGHTVGRAIETVSDYKLLHGEGVAIGLVAQALLSESLGFMNAEQVERVIALLEKAGLPTKIPAYIDREELVQKLYTDKKVRSGKLRFVLQKGIGAVVEFAPGVYAKTVEEEIVRHILEKM
jgi:3-dehydroquinate synthase